MTEYEPFDRPELRPSRRERALLWAAVALSLLAAWLAAAPWAQWMVGR